MKIPYSQFPWHRTYKSDSLIDEFYENGYVKIRLDGVEYDGISKFVKRAICQDDKSPVSDLWKTSEHIRSLATHNYVMRIINRLYDKECFPFRTHNFLHGSERHLSSNMMWTNSIPQYYMCCAWTAIEDVEYDNGPIIAYPGSHRLPYMSLDMVGLQAVDYHNSSGFVTLQSTYEKKLTEYCKSLGEPVKLLLNKGECIVMAANLLYGKLPASDRNRTSLTQATYYYFKDQKYYVPWFSTKSSIYYINPNVIG